MKKKPINNLSQLFESYAGYKSLDDMVDEFLQRRFNKTKASDPGYWATWKARFANGSPEMYMDSETLKVWDEMQDEKKKEIDEMMTTSANVAGYNTPNAFSATGKTAERVKNAIKRTGFTEVEETHNWYRNTPDDHSRPLADIKKSVNESKKLNEVKALNITNVKQDPFVKGHAYLLNTKEGHNKFYEMNQLNDKVFEVTYGKIGTFGQKAYYDLKDWNTLLQAKKKKGYVVDSQTEITESKKLKENKKYPDEIKGERMYVEKDKEDDLWHVFGNKSGHSYYSNASKENAEGKLKELQATDKIKTESKYKEFARKLYLIERINKVEPLDAEDPNANYGVFVRELTDEAEVSSEYYDDEKDAILRAENLKKHHMETLEDYTVYIEVWKKAEDGTFGNIGKPIWKWDAQNLNETIWNNQSESFENWDEFSDWAVDNGFKVEFYADRKAGTVGDDAEWEENGDGSISVEFHEYDDDEEVVMEKKLDEARTIGKVKEKKLKQMILDMWLKNHNVSSEEIFDKVPDDWFETWEMAYQEIQGIIYDELMDFAHNPPKGNKEPWFGENKNKK